MIKKSSDEPADKARERLRQFETAREPVPDENADEKLHPEQTPEKANNTSKKPKPNQTEKNK